MSSMKAVSACALLFLPLCAVAAPKGGTAAPAGATEVSPAPRDGTSPVVLWFISDQSLNPGQAREFHLLVQSSYEQIDRAEKSKQGMSRANKDVIKRMARSRAATFLSGRPFEAYCRFEEVLLFYRPNLAAGPRPSPKGPPGESGRLFNKILKDAEQSLKQEL